MARPLKGDVVVIPFPFSDLTQTKRRPALVLATPDGNDVILCQITSQAVRDRYAVSLAEIDFTQGGLHQPSNVRPNHIFTADQAIILYRAGVLKPDKLTEIVERTVEILRA